MTFLKLQKETREIADQDDLKNWGKRELVKKDLQQVWVEVTKDFIGWLTLRGIINLDIPAKAVAIEYDPYRTARIALLYYADGEKRYVLAWQGTKLGQVVVNGPILGEIVSGNRNNLKIFLRGCQSLILEITPYFLFGKLIKS